MSFRRGGGKKRRDANEASIRTALAAYGAQSLQISGTGLPDLLVLYRGRWMPLEVKTEKGRFTNAQSAILWPVVRSVDEALAAIGING